MTRQPATGERAAHRSSSEGQQAALLRIGIGALQEADPELAQILDAEVQLQNSTLAMIASASIAAPSVLAAGGAALSNVTAEGYPGARYHPGAQQFDQVERLAVERAKLLFGAKYANVQPHSCSSANLAVFAALMKPGDVLMGLDLDAGGHLTHGSRASVSGRHYRPVPYGLDSSGRIDFAQLTDLVAEHRPRVLVAGASAYPRTVDFARFREIADSVGAYLLADISHIAGLVAAGRHPNPIDLAHVTTTSTYKQLGGPRGGLILSGREFETPGPDGRTPLHQLMQRAVFPQSQGTPSPATIAAKARAFANASEPAFRETARLIVRNARALANELSALGYRILTGGTDNHMVLIDVTSVGLTGVTAERALEECGILANRNRIPGDTKPPLITSGLRLGTNILAQRGMGPDEMSTCARLLHTVLSATSTVSDTDYRIDPSLVAEVRDEVRWVCARHPLPIVVPGPPVPAPLTGVGA
ncbi:serine hydroxymethyltransferase [Streptacidiphilus pinicola]|uniref:Probable serine hydroxymethyltransferase n=1 Tax=Streptacidiphilus pinicola TaxID=2219663 RepID=A0A2X0J4A8_9ACTN|nr:serine hydroxymethyltransferase [Streptacidiphilus pinicola]RAG85066.1 serine hydroxymethyltransferase [Streptacidiphilus pinicola]